LLRDLPPFPTRRSSDLAPVSTPTRWPLTCVATNTGTNALTMSSAITGSPNFAPYVRQTLVAPMLPLPTERMSTPFVQRTSQYPRSEEHTSELQSLAYLV